MDLVKYEVFVKTVECGSLSEAARTLGYTQSNVSHIIQNLETRMGLTLMLRSKSGIVLTEQGKQLLPMMQKILEDNDRMEHKVEDIKNKKYGVLRIGTSNGVACVWLPECLKRFKRDYPEIHIELVEMSSSEIVDSLTAGNLDVGFITDKGDSEIDFMPLYQDELLAVVPNTESYAKLAAYPLKKFGEDPFIYPTHSLKTYVNAVLNEVNIRPLKALEVYGDDAVIAMVENELGVSILPKLSLENRNPNLLSLPLIPRHYRVVGIGFSKYETNTEIVNIFIDYLMKVVKDKSQNMSAG